jgi:hypothetical protein
MKPAAPSLLAIVAAAVCSSGLAAERPPARVRPLPASLVATETTMVQPPPVVLEVSPEAVVACRGTVGIYGFRVTNNTGAATSFDLLYSGFSWTVSGEATVGPIPDGASRVFEVVHRVPVGALPGESDTGTVTARDQAGPDSGSVEITTSVDRYVVSSGPAAPNARMDHTVLARNSDALLAVAGFAPDVPPAAPVTISGVPPGVTAPATATVNIYYQSIGLWFGRRPDVAPIPFSGDMAFGTNVSGETILVAFPDATGLSDLMLHVYNLTRNRWSRATVPTGFPPAGIWAHDVACDPPANTCYISGGATQPGGGDLATVYAYDVAANTVSPLPPFSTPRAHHASFLVDGLLCVAGGIGVGDVPISSTQCYDLAAGSWNSENADLGPLPGSLWGMGDAVIEIDGVERPVLAAGVYDGGLPGGHLLWHDGAAWNVDTPFATGVYRAEADAVGDTLFLVGGSTGGLTPSTAFQRLRWCPDEPPPNDDCDTATDIELFECVTVTNWLATDSGPPSPSCANYQGGDVWLRVTVPESEERWLNTNLGYGSPYQWGLASYGECPHAAEILCAGASNDLFALGPMTGPGTYWVRVWEQGNDAFGELTLCLEDGIWIPVELVTFTVE